MTGAATAIILASLVNNAAPIVAAVLAETVSERSGVLNLGLEGVMLIGALTAAWVAVATGSVEVGLLAAAAAGLVVGALYALLVNGLKLNQIIAGVAVYMLGVSVSTMAGRWLERFTLPPPASIGVFNVAPLVVLVLPVLVHLSLKVTGFDRLMRAVGDNPLAADMMGVDVARVRSVAVLINGALAGLAGGLIVGYIARRWITMVTAGLGWLSIALTPATLWEPILAYIPGVVYAGAVVLRYLGVFSTLPPELQNAVPYVVVLAVAGVAARAARRYIPRSLGSIYVHGASV